MKQILLSYSILFFLAAGAQNTRPPENASADEEKLHIILCTAILDYDLPVNLQITDHPLPHITLPSFSEATSFLPISNSKKFWFSTRDVIGSYGLFLSVLFAAPPGFTKWDEPFGRRLFANAGEQFHKSWTSPPTMDGDTFFTNFISHPYAGSFYYNSMRTRGGSAAASFRFALFSSTLWEYGPEAFFEQPSIQDLIITPIVGSVVGELTHRMTFKMSVDGFTIWEKIAVFLLNPSYVLNHGFKSPSESRRKQMLDMKNTY